MVLSAVWTGGEHAAAIATAGGESLLQAADRTPGGLDWGIVPAWPSRGPNCSHGTAGIARALAVAGVAPDRPDFLASLDGDGFVVPHTIPLSKREVEPLTYTWCVGDVLRTIHLS